MESLNSYGISARALLDKVEIQKPAFEQLIRKLAG
jgi:hypothetical protein